MNRTARRRIFRFIAVTFGLLPIVLLELGLRLLGIASPVTPSAQRTDSLSAIDNDPLVDLHALRPLFVTSEDGKKMEIGEERMNFFRPASFSIEKPESTLRVFALGGSTTQGQPYLPETAFPKWLEMRLQAALPNQNVEVINCGGISYASYRVSAILNEVLEYSPDMILLYTGHNEFLEARTYDRQLAVPRWLAKPISLISKLRIARVLGQIMQGDRTTNTPQTRLPSEVDTLLDHVDGMEAYERDESWIRGVHHHFRLTLENMVSRCENANVPLVLCIPASDLVNTPPFKSVPEASLSPEQQLAISQAVDVIQSDSKLAFRIDAAELILKLDPKHALANFAIGRWGYESADDDKANAIKHLTLARDHDVCPLRATSAVESAVRQFSNHQNVLLIDVPKQLDRRDSKRRPLPDGVADPEWFVDHVHPSIEGHQEIAGEIFDCLAAKKIFDLEQATSDRYDSAVAEHLKTLGEDYFGRAKQRLEGVNRWSRRIP